MITLKQLGELNRLLIRYQKQIMVDLDNCKSENESVNIPEITDFITTIVDSYKEDN
jgi:hypothetical protein